MFIEVEGGRKANGELAVQGSKNAVLPMIAATVLCRGTTIFENCPKIKDVYSMIAVLRQIGADVSWDEDKLIIDTGSLNKSEMIQKEAGELRASVLFLGSVLARTGTAEIRMPGGCSIGTRPINYHLAAFEALGVETEQDENVIRCKIRHKGTCTVRLPYPSVGATENVILYAVLRDGETILENAAKEPEIEELCRFLRKMGACIKGNGKGRILIRGVEILQGTTYRPGTDRIAFLTYAAMAAGTGGCALLKVWGDTFEKEKMYLRKAGCCVRDDGNHILISGNDGICAIPYIKTAPYPGFPTDAQSLFLALLSKARGESVVEEDVFENRFQVVRQLRKMGADIEVVGQRAYIRGVTKLHGECVRSTDLRSGAALLVAGAMAEGKSQVVQPEYILRGYEAPVEAMQNLGLCARYVV